MQSVADGSSLHGEWHLRLESFLPFGNIDPALKFWVHHQAMHSITLEMVGEISHGFFSDLREISCCEIYNRGIIPTQPPPPPCQVAYQSGKTLGVEKIDLDKFRSPPSYQIFPSILRILCAMLCTSNTGCREGFLCAACSANA